MNQRDGRSPLPGTRRPAAGLRLGPFALDRCIATGGTGEVWRATHTATALPVAVKVLPEAARPDLRRSFQREVRAVASLAHPHVVAVLDVGEVDSDLSGATSGQWAPGTPWMALELCSGGTLGSSPPANYPALRSVLLQILDALAHAHAHGVVHRDLKPGNVLWSTPGDVRPGLKLTDFGVAALMVSDDTDPTLLAPSAGTPSFMAPEQLLGDVRRIGPWTDLYALGCVAWTLCVGRAPYQRQSAMSTARAHLHGERPAFLSPYPVPPGLEAWLDALLQRDPVRRPECAADAMEALLALDDDEEDVEDEVTASMDLPVTIREDEPTQRSFLDEDELVEAAFGAPGDDEQGTDDGRLPPPTELAPWSTGRRSHQSPLRGAGLGLLSVREPPLVGRDRVMEAVWRELGFVFRSRRPRVIELRGRQGVGTSRVLTSVAWRAAEVGGFEVVRVPRGVEPLARMAALRFRVEAMAGVERRQALVADGLGDDEADAVSALLDGGLDADARVGVAAQLVRRLARRRPVLLCIDDAHRQAEGLALLRRLVDERAAVAGLLAVDPVQLEGREAEARRLDGFDALQVELTPLSEAAMGQVAHGLVALDAELTSSVVAKAAGRPAFVVELLRAWAERDWLLPGPRGFTLPADIPLAMPDDVEDAWRRRVDHLVSRLEPAAGWDLHVAAVLGLEVEERLWHTACDDPDGEGHGWSPEGIGRRQRLLDTLIRAQLVVERPGGFAFAHRILRERLCSDAKEQGRWAPLNLACAEALIEHEVQAQGRLGRHLRAGRRAGAAIGPLLRAARDALHSEPQQAMVWMREAEDAAHDAALDPADPRSGELLVARAEVHLGLGEGEDAARWARWAQRAAATHGPKHTGDSEVAWWRVMRSGLQLELDAALAQDHREEAAALLPKLAPVVRRLRDPVPWGDLLMAQAALQATLPDGAEVALGLLDEAVVRFEAGHRRDRSARAERAAAGLELRLGRTDEALARIDRALAGGAGADRVLIGELTLSRGELLAVLGAAEQALEVLQRGRSVLASLGRRRSRAEALIGVLESLVGRLADGAATVSRVAERSVRPGLVGFVALARALTVARLRRWGEVPQLLQRAEGAGLPRDAVVVWMVRRFVAECETAGFAGVARRAEALTPSS